MNTGAGSHDDCGQQAFGEAAGVAGCGVLEHHDELVPTQACGYRVGLTIAPVMPVDGWRDSYGRLLDDVAVAMSDVPDRS